jgi:hypothetical protein
MKRLTWFVFSFVMIACTGASANSVTYTVTSASLGISPNDGTGDNVGFTIQGPGMNLVGVGGTDYFSFGTSPTGFAPGSIGSGGMAFSPDYLLQGNLGAYGTADIEMNGLNGSILGGAFTFPSNGANYFTVTVPAYLSGITGMIVAGQGPSFFTEPFALSGIEGQETLSYYYSPFFNVYYPAQATFSASATSTTPEPDTLVLMGTGLCAILASLRRKHRA